ncbi:MAG: RHS domain-containing protein [Deltaproteobacteria bacterium]|nr:RHS domain-containing protein [Deltaproteobacteria bacterium]
MQKVGSIYYWYQNDHLGTPQKLIGTNGLVVWSATYDSFGNMQITTEKIRNNLRFPGQHHDAETGLYYNLNRYYDPNTGRYFEDGSFLDRAESVCICGRIGGHPLELHF